MDNPTGFPSRQAHLAYIYNNLEYIIRSLMLIVQSIDNELFPEDTKGNDDAKL